jgi:hypothetical protein
MRPFVDASARLTFAGSLGGHILKSARPDVGTLGRLHCNKARAGLGVVRDLAIETWRFVGLSESGGGGKTNVKGS